MRWYLANKYGLYTSWAICGCRRRKQRKHSYTDNKGWSTTNLKDLKRTTNAEIGWTIFVKTCNIWPWRIPGLNSQQGIGSNENRPLCLDTFPSLASGMSTVELYDTIDCSWLLTHTCACGCVLVSLTELCWAAGWTGRYFKRNKNRRNANSKDSIKSIMIYIVDVMCILYIYKQYVQCTYNISYELIVLQAVYCKLQYSC